METIARTVTIPSGQNQFIQENVFNSAPIRRRAIAMNRNSAFKGHFQENPFHYQKFGLREPRVVRGVVRGELRVVRGKSFPLSEIWFTRTKSCLRNCL